MNIQDIQRQVNKKRMIGDLTKAKVNRPIGYISPGGFIKTAKGWRKATGKDRTTKQPAIKDKLKISEKVLEFKGEEVMARISGTGYRSVKLYGAKGDIVYVKDTTGSTKGLVTTKHKISVADLGDKWKQKIYKMQGRKDPSKGLSAYERRMKEKK